MSATEAMLVARRPLGTLISPDEYALSVEKFRKSATNKTETFTHDALAAFVAHLFDLAESRIESVQVKKFGQSALVIEEELEKGGE